MSDGHIFDGDDYIEYWCENCDKILLRIPYTPVDFDGFPVITF